MKYTDQQQNAIDARESSIIVSAAAGSGKTAVLTERLAQILADSRPENKVRADRIVVVTFTKAAAAEMRKRLNEKLTDLMKEMELSGNEVGYRYLVEQQVLLQNAKISTIDSFCFDLLRENITDEHGITSGFTVLDESDEKVIKSQAMDELLDWYSENEYDKISYLYDSFCFKDYKPLINTIALTDEFLSSVAIVSKWFAETGKEYEKKLEDSVYYKKFFDNIWEKACYVHNILEKNVEIIKDVFPDMSVPQAEKSLEQAEKDFSKAQKFMDIATHRRFPTEEENEYIADFDKLVTVSKKVNHNEILREIYKQNRESAKKVLKDIAKSFDAVADDFNDSKKVTEIILEVVKKYREIIWEKKCGKNAISFDDGENLILELLVAEDENHNIIQSETARSIAENYDIIMIDEYQDSNNKQDLIFKLISNNFKSDKNGKPMYGDNAFLVGDVKQAIYGFRLANPQNFINIVESSTAYDKDSNEKNQSILLNDNFRSSQETVNFINFIFGKIMSKKCGDIDYNDKEELKFGALPYKKEQDKINMFPDIMLINSDYADTEVIENPEAEATAEKIAEMIRTGVPVVDGEETRPCKPSDFCILMYAKAPAKYYVNALEKRGIPARGSEEKGYLKSREIVILLDLLRVIANPLQDIAVTAVMLSPMYMFSIEELSYIKSFDREKMIYQILIDIANDEIEECDIKLAVRCKEFLKSIEHFRLDSVTMTIGELINSIYDTTDFISVMQIHKDGSKKRANLRMLIQYAQNYEKFASADGRGGLSGFLRYIDRLSKDGDYNQGKVSASSGDYVTVQTIHKSKGLEYPFVFICETSAEFTFDTDAVMCGDDYRIGFTLYSKELVCRYKTFQYKMLKDEKDRNILSEKMRLLYVEMTRAKQKLFINLDCGSESIKKLSKMVNDCYYCGGEIKNLVLKSESFAEWIWLCLMIHSEFPAIAELIGLDIQSGFPAYDNSEKLFEYEFVSDEKINGKEVKNEFVSAQADDIIVKNLIDIMNTDYDRTLSETTAKLSVTQISKKFSETEEFDFHLQRPKFISESQKMTGAERGTAIHTFFQYCNFENAVADTEAEIKRLAELGFISNAQAECIEPAKVRAFFESELYSRIKSAIKYEREKKFMVLASQIQTNNPVFEKFRNSDNMIKGIIDLMYEDKDGIVIVDYKSDRGISAEGLKERYTGQLQIYKSAIELITGKKVKELVIYSIELKKAIIL